MNVLFAITNINGTYDDAYSFGLASIASFTRDKGFGYDYAIINTEDCYADFFDLVDRMRPRIIAYTSVSSQFMFVKELSARVKEIYHDDVIQVCGGIHTTIFPESILEAEGLDGIFIGESEYAFSDFLDRAEKNLPYSDVNNFAYNDHGKLIRNSLYPLITDLDDLPFPERDKYEYERFIRNPGYATFIFSRGCPFRCSYCSNHAIAKVYNMKVNKPRFRSPEKCIEEIKQLMNKYAIPKVFIGDDTFGINKEWTREFCLRYAKEIKLPLMVQLRVNLVDEETMKYLKIAGCVHVSCGIESGNDYIRNEIMRRYISKEEMINAYSLFKKYRISSNAINMIGLPYETVDSIWDTIKINREINPTSSGVNIFYPYRGTDLGDYCFKNGLVDEELYHDFSEERRASVLKFSEEFKGKLSHFHKHWAYVVYRCRPWKLGRLYVTGYLKNRFPQAWNRIRSLKRLVKLKA